VWIKPSRENAKRGSQAFLRFGIFADSAKNHAIFDSVDLMDCQTRKSP
jgi:hypothetical protein